MFAAALVIVIINLIPGTVQYMDFIGQVPADVVNQFLSQNGMSMDQAQQLLNTQQGQQLAQQVLQGEISLDQAQNIAQNTNMPDEKNQDTNYQSQIENSQNNEQQSKSQNDASDKNDDNTELQRIDYNIVQNQNQEIFDSSNNVENSISENQNQDVQTQQNQQSNDENSQNSWSQFNNNQQQNQNDQFVNDNNNININFEQSNQHNEELVQNNMQQSNTESNNGEYNAQQQNKQNYQNNDVENTNSNNDGLRQVTSQQLRQGGTVEPENYQEKFQKLSTNVGNFLRGIQSPVSEESSENVLEEMFGAFLAPVQEFTDQKVDDLPHQEPEVETAPQSEGVTVIPNDSEVVNVTYTPLDFTIDLGPDDEYDENGGGTLTLALGTILLLNLMLYCMMM
eukprot:TRINITY_DN4013_c0_g1_i4.p1 TRINITY_DN4013_c0_g1~~TRINITY_DN4013_c0_g1_i4.p1  ORF type:complete len:395 (-),score=60.75 TRINITY_DN4013_c0_g1_i4:123-1307(-)